MVDAATSAAIDPAEGRRQATLNLQNWMILCTVSAANAALLWAAAHAGSSLGILAAAILFGFTNNSAFSLLHEAVHGKFDTASSLRNAMAGHIAAAFFPTSFTLQTALHLTHHRNNRSELERFDYIGPGEKVPLKTMQWFTILTGLYWVSIPLFWIVYAFVGGLVPWDRIMPPGNRFARQTSAGEFLESARKLPLGRIRVELAISLVLQAAFFWLLDLSAASWLICYFAFGLMWSSLQYADHAFSRLDQFEGAWNLRVSLFTRAMFLNYHDHLEHHRDPGVRWQELPRHARGSEKRHFLSMLYLMWRGPRLLPGFSQSKSRQRQMEWTVLACHAVIFGAAFQLIYGFASVDFAARHTFFDVALPIDAQAPFWPLWSAAYITIGPLLLVVALILRLPERTLPFLATLLFQLVIAGVCFLVFPVREMPLPIVEITGYEAILFSLADGINLTGNMMPSLHVTLAISAAWAAGAHMNAGGRIAIWSWSLAICASTWLIRQHWLLDIAGGMMLAGFAMGIVYPRLQQRLLQLEAEFRPGVARPG